ncbi:OTT-1508-deam domain containing protein [Pyrenophora tritici-repentis]|uniref:OTT-1508-deam domain containing protein n=2 Tax=Pyrenophora tritici-repentis TaxID=45151 RepID=A0A922ND35_9PLEO|nr:OTT-1508-deam domain containing protein [Pyrenophora tritici-repentis]KAI1678647.1 OTT-1508-deam domain containing protein [Pyrenophora tritici-repentis]
MAYEIWLMFCNSKTTVSNYIPKDFAQQLICKDNPADRSDALLCQVIMRGKDRFMRRLNYVPSSNPQQAMESTTARRLKRVLDYAQRVNPELKQSRRHLFNLAEEFGYLSQLSVTSNHDESAGASSVRSLVAIAKIVSKMWKRHGDLLPKLIASVPNFDMDPCARDSLKLRLGHIGHYLPTVRRLLSFAGRFRVFGSIQILPIHFKPYDLSIALDRHRSDLQQQRLQAVTQSLRVTNAWQQKLGDAKINGKRNVTTYIKQAQSGGHFRVHAEIQILCYYEHYPITAYPPRVLKSSKDACFLCNLFVKTHGKFYISKTHGKVYSPWMLPDLYSLALSKKHRKNFVRVTDVFNRALEETIVTSALRAKRTIPEPHESGIFSLVHSSYAASDATIRGPSESRSLACLGTPTGMPTVSTPESMLPLTQKGAPSQPEPLQSADETVQVAASIFPPPILYLQQGKPFTCVFDETEPYLRFHTPKIHVEISHEEAQRLADINPPSNHEKMLVAITIEVTWLGSDESNEMTTPKDHSINLDSRWTELTAVDGILFTDEGLLMRKGDDIVRVRALHVDSHQGERKDSLHD